MSASLQVPDSLTDQLRAFRDRVWTTKVAEAILLGVVGLLLAFLTVYSFDRFVDTSQLTRSLIFAAALAVWLFVPWSLHRWVWRNRRLDQLARLLRVRESAIGDQLLSVIELAENQSEQARSPALCSAAIAQVAEAAKHKNFIDAAPPTFVRSLSGIVSVSGIIAAALMFLFPAASNNAWARFLSPWNAPPRYTFTSLEPIADEMIVPHGEAVLIQFRLRSDSRNQPEIARLQVANFPSIESQLADGVYEFELPPQTVPIAMQLSVGDFVKSIAIEPRLRPELVGSTATVRLPDYLERAESVEQDVRSGTLSVVHGSAAEIVAKASRPLAEAKVNDQPRPVEQTKFSTSSITVGQDKLDLELWWRDHDGLAGREPFNITISPTIDEAPSVLSQELPRQAVVLDSEQINFQALAADDFGIKRIGMSWRGLDETGPVEVSKGEKLLSLGTPNATSLQVAATFSATGLGIEPQPIEVQLWVEDYLPNRPRVYSAPHVLFVLTAEQHAVWIMNQMSKWHRAALDVRDKELQLFEDNKRLRSMSAEELSDDSMREELRRQASAESSNARRLAALAKAGEGLLRQAARNPEIGVGHLDRWAEMLQILNEIGASRMPSVADLLDRATKEPQLARGGPSKPSAPQAGKNKSTPPAGSGQDDKDKIAGQPKMPSISDAESSLQPNEGEAGEPGKKKYDGSRLSLPKTTLTGPPKKSKSKSDEEAENDKEESSVDQAIVEQADLLAEFERIAEELTAILANLEGSTLVKRLKLASREQEAVAEKISLRIATVFGRGARTPHDEVRELLQISKGEEDQRQAIAFIMDDMQAYFERRKMTQFKNVLDEMKSMNVLDAMSDLVAAIPKEQGISIAEAEYWSDTLDRWGEDLVDPACSGQCPGCKTSDALPPSLILEVLKILENEVNLREATRVAEQARPGLTSEVHSGEANRLSQSQATLSQRTDAVVTAIKELPNGEQRFTKEVALLDSVSIVMQDATSILASDETGSKAIAAETEAIELLLQCKRINPNAGGGGGNDPGGGGTGETQDSALALLGSGLNQNERREAREVNQATGESSRALPEEFRAGLDEYFKRLERRN